MDVFQTALLIGAIVVATINYNQPRALFWIALAAANFAFTDWYFYHALSWLPHPFVTGVADAFLVIFLATYGIHRWERFVRYAYMLSILVSLSYLAGWIPNRTSYAIGLEGCNWIALLIMGSAGIARLIDAKSDRRVVGQSAGGAIGRGVHRVRDFWDAERRPKGVLAKALGQN